jgi:guanine deaminase
VIVYKSQITIEVMEYKPIKKFMERAINIARHDNKKYEEWLFGAVVVKNGRVIAESGNRIFRDTDPSAHAEISAMRIAAKKLGTKYLHDCILYTTNEPCSMCTTCAIWAEVKGIVYGANVKDLENHWKKEGAKRTFLLSSSKTLSHLKPRDIFLVKNYMRKDCLELFSSYAK